MLSIRPLISIVAKDTIFYGLASILSRSVTLLTLPLLARYFSVEEYGLFDYYYVTIALLITFFLFGQESAIFRYFYDADDDASRTYLVTRSLTCLLLFIMLIYAFLFFFKDFFIDFFQISNETKKIFLIIISIIPFGILYTVSETILRLTRDLKKYIILTIGFTFSTLMVVIYVTQVFEADLYIIFNFFFYIWVFFGVLGLFMIRKWITLPQTILPSKKMLFYGIPMGAVVFVEASQPFFERLIISNLISAESLGLYAAASKLAIIVLLPIGAFNMAFMPLVMRIYSDKNSIEVFNLSLTIYIILLTLLVLVLSVISGPIISILAGNVYLDGAKIVFPLVLALYFQAIAGVIGIGAVISQKTYLRFLITIVAQAFGYGLMILLLNQYNIMGVAIGVALGKALMMILYAILGHKLYPLAWNYPMVIVMVLITTFYGSFLSFIEISSILDVMLFISSLIIIMITGWSFLSTSEKDAIRLTG